MSDDARIPRLSSDSIDAALRPTFDAFVASRGKVPNLFRVAAHRPAIAATLAAHLEAVMGAGEVPILLKELIAVRVSRLNDCQY